MIIYRGLEHGFRPCPRCGTIEIWNNVNDAGEVVSYSVNCKCKALPALENHRIFRLQLEWNKATKAEEEKMIKENLAKSEPITRCKDCWAYETAEYDDGYKKRFCHLFKRQMQEDDFCSYGEPCDCFEKHSIAKIDRKESESEIVPKLTPDQFKEKYCDKCGSQRCLGPGSEWFDGCQHKNEIKKIIATIKAGELPNDKSEFGLDKRT